MAKAEVTLKIEQAEMTRLLVGGSGEATKLVLKATRAISNAAKVKSPVDTGVLRNSIRQDPLPRTSGLSVTSHVEATSKYAMSVHEGQKAHVITPKNARALRFTVGGRVVFAKSVNHPGSKGRPFLRNAMEEEGKRLGFVVTR